MMNNIFNPIVLFLALYLTLLVIRLKSKFEAHLIVSRNQRPSGHPLQQVLI